MAHKLADELLTIILSPQLVVSDELFANTRAISPFTKVEKSASDVLLVCKRWMRFATPALYQTVILRSTAQAQALALALAENSRLGAFIMKLRIEGAYGRYILDIVQRAPNITDFCFTLTVWSTCSVSGLVKSLKLLNPTRVILTLTHALGIRNSKRTELVSALYAAIPTWTRLRIFHFPTSGFGRSYYELGQHPEFEDHPELLEALSQSPSLKSLYIWRRAWSSSSAAPLNVFATNASTVETIWLLQDYPYSEPDDVVACRLFGLDSPLRLRVRVPVSRKLPSFVGALRRQRPTASALNHNPFYQPMSEASEATKSMVWAKIIGFALRSDSFAKGRDTVWYRRAPWFDPNCWYIQATSALLLVSRSFSAILRRVLFKHIAITNNRAMCVIQQYLQQDPSLASETETAHITCRNPLPILSQLTNLRICVARICPIVFSTLPPDSLVEIILVNQWDDKPPLTPSMLSPFTHLKTLTWGCDTGHPIDIDDHIAASETLAHLEQLDVGYAPDTFLDMLALFRLPKLVEVEMGLFYGDGTSFFDAHGAKIKRLSVGAIDADVLRACTSLEVLELHQQSEKKRVRRAISPLEIGHRTLRQIEVHWWLETDRDGLSTRVWKDFFDSFTRARYPALQDIHLKHKGAGRLWPYNEREIRASPWPEIAEKLAAEGIAVRDREGRAWRARLKLQ